MQDVRICPSCGGNHLEVIDCRKSRTSFRRRLSCKKCGCRFTTYEIMDVDFKHFMELDKMLKEYYGR